eukprot:Rmarinus@m.16278
MDSALIIDNGAGDIKFGRAGQDVASVKILPNCVGRAKVERKPLYGEDILNYHDSSLSLSRPFERGYCTNWDLEKEIWDHMFSAENVSTDGQMLVTTTPFVCMQPIADQFEELIFEEYKFGGAFIAPAAYYCARDYQIRSPDVNPCVLVIESGFSFSHIAPYFNTNIVTQAVRRVNVGGKLLTNQLKETISYRSWNMMDEGILINRIKERLCYVSQDFKHDMAITRLAGKKNPILREYVLPSAGDGYVRGEDEVPPIPSTAGLSAEDIARIKDEEQVLVMNSERIAIPEVLFHPSDVGLGQAGVAEAAVQAVEATPQALHSSLYGNVLLIGGSSAFEGYKGRIELELRAMIPGDYDLRVSVPDAPLRVAAWQSMSTLAQGGYLSDDVVTKAQYEEYGHQICQAKFQASRAQTPLVFD